jgi:hypothetical protein
LQCERIEDETGRFDLLGGAIEEGGLFTPSSFPELDDVRFGREDHTRSV